MSRGRSPARRGRDECNDCGSRSRFDARYDDRRYDDRRFDDRDSALASSTSASGSSSRAGEIHVKEEEDSAPPADPAPVRPQLKLPAIALRPPPSPKAAPIDAPKASLLPQSGAASGMAELGRRWNPLAALTSLATGAPSTNGAASASKSEAVASTSAAVPVVGRDKAAEQRIAGMIESIYDSAVREPYPHHYSYKCWKIRCVCRCR